MFPLILAMIYLAFISLGLPDSLLGSAWPSMYQEFSVPVSYSGIVFMIIALGTIVSSLQSDRLIRRFGTGKITAVSVLMTAAALFGFSISRSFLALCLWAVPYGLGAGSVDAALNNYVAIHYSSRHMSWLHCMWGVGASLGPYIMRYGLTAGSWNTGYRIIGVLQLVLTTVLFLSLPLWKARSAQAKSAQEEGNAPQSLSLGEVLEIPGAKEVMAAFFCYCALEQTAGLWISSYLALNRGLAVETAAGLASLFFVGITAGRFISGFLTSKLNDTQMIRLGQGVALLGILIIFLHLGTLPVRLGLLLLGLGCAPIYPSIIHSTPALFGADRSQAMIGVQMAFAYIGNCLIPPLFGLIANHIGIGLFPGYLLVFLGAMVLLHERMLVKVREYGKSSKKALRLRGQRG